MAGLNGYFKCVNPKINSFNFEGFLLLEMSLSINQKIKSQRLDFFLYLCGLNEKRYD